MMSFGQALLALRLGQEVRRRSWEKDRLSLILKETQIVWVSRRYGNHITEWVPTQRSILADDWEVIRQKPPT